MRLWVVLLLAAVAVVTALVLCWWLWQRRVRRRLPPPPIPRHPVVLVHGILGFDKIGVGAVAQDYFRGIIGGLTGSGVKVYVPRLPPLGSVPARAERLAEYIRSLPETKVNVVAHSMGGLDARWAIARLGIGDRIAALVTVGTPHRGSPVAAVASGGPAAALRRWVARLGLPSEAVEWLTPNACARIAQEAPDDPRVLYASIVCRTPRTLWAANPLLVPTWYFLRSHGDSDGLVPTSSQRWGDTWAEVEVDHWGQIGWSLSASAAAMYARILSELAARGC